MAPTVLRADPTPLDDSWDFRGITLPRARNRNMGKHISFKPQLITIDIAHFPDNRILRGDDLSKFILASFAEFRFPNTGPSVARDYMIRFFKAGLNLNDVHYRFYGHSNSQLRGRSCFLREARTDLELDNRISLLGDFNKLMNAAKRAKRIGLLFSAASMDWELDEKYTEDIPDIVSGGELFSDGCGLISKQLAILVSRKKRIIFHSKNYTPCVYQIRYKGYKGVVMLHPDLDQKRGKLIQFRSSQKKFKATGDNTFSVVDYSVPYAYHRLNDDIIVLLSSLGVTTEKFLAKQQAYFDWIIKAGTSWEIAFDFLTSLNKFDVAEKLLLRGIDSPEVKAQIQASQNSEVASFQKKDRKDHFRTRMIIHKSRFLFGVCDPYQVLREGEVHVRITVPRKGATTLTQIDLLVVRNPCLHPGDCLKLRAVAHPRLSHLVDCVVFPTVGRRAAPSMSSGGDLDGDRFFVMFDPDLMPTRVAESYNYPEGRPPPPKNVTRQDLAQHFSSYNSIDMARVAALHRKWVYASPDGAMCSQCQELNALYSSSVDGGKIKIPDRLKSPPDSRGPYVLDILADAAKSFAENFVQFSREVNDNMNPVTAHDTIVRLLSTEKLAVSEYEVFTMALDLARRHDLDLRQYLTHVNFSALTTPQKHAMSLLLDLEPEMHPYVWNSLIRSDIITPQELRHRSLDGPLRLQRLYASHIQGRPAFFEYLREAIEDYTRKLIIVKTDDRFSIGIFIKRQLPFDEDGDIDDNVVICSFMPQSSDRGRSTYRQGTKGYKFFCDENIMQIFNRQRGDTFVFITRPPEKSGADIAASVALQKISKAVQQCGRVQRTPVSAIEIHVISNRDRVAHQAFDLRFEHVQTEEYLGRFDHIPVPYTPNSLVGYSWTNSVPEKRIIFMGTEDEARHELTRISGDALDDYMDFALQHRAEDQLFWMFKELLGREPLDHGRIALRMSRHPPLAYVVLKKYLGEDTSELPDEVHGLGPSIIREIIRSANQLGIAALVALEKLSADIRRLDIPQYFELLWLAAVSIRPRKLVQEVLMVLHDCCGPNREGRDVLDYVHRHALAVVFDHAEEAADECPCDDAGRPTKQRTAPVKVKLVPVKPRPTDGTEEADGNNSSVRETNFRQVMAHVRVDASTTVRIHSHIRLQVASKAEHSTIERAVVDAIVIQASRGELRLELLHTLPPEFEVMDWNMYPAGSVATARAMLDAILRLAEDGLDCCKFHNIITGTGGTSVHEDAPAKIPLNDNDDIGLSFLNQSQREAVKSAVAENDRLALIWGPPGTGKTTVIVQILLRFLRDVSEIPNPPNLLMTASTHNAVDNVLERFLTENDKAKILDHEQILRVATDPSKVAKAHQRFTVDARVGGSITENPRLIQKAEKRLKDARIVFTTCAGAGLGIMRKYDFEIVLIDEASQVTEACALIPLVKGCKRAVLVGDHVQLRPTVKPMGKALEFDVSLLERLYTGSSITNVSRAMLEVQYRFSDDIGRFPSTEFYDGRLRSGLQLSKLNEHDQVLKTSSFPWPKEGSGRVIPNVFVACASEEDYGQSSKSNFGQVRLVRHIITLLQKNGTPPEAGIKKDPPSIAVLTPYSRQLTRLREVLPSEITSSTIDGFQGRESDIVIFSTVRCNAEGDIGFVEDARRLNVAWTRPRLALIIVGDKRTLEAHSTLWIKAIKDCAQLEIPPPES